MIDKKRIDELAAVVKEFGKIMVHGAEARKLLWLARVGLFASTIYFEEVSTITAKTKGEK